MKRWVAEPEDKPWKLREFIAADLDSNVIHALYDFAATENRRMERKRENRSAEIPPFQSQPR